MPTSISASLRRRAPPGGPRSGASLRSGALARVAFLRGHRTGARRRGRAGRTAGAKNSNLFLTSLIFL